MSSWWHWILIQMVLLDFPTAYGSCWSYYERRMMLLSQDKMLSRFTELKMHFCDTWHDLMAMLLSFYCIKSRHDSFFPDPFSLIIQSFSVVPRYSELLMCDWVNHKTVPCTLPCFKCLTDIWDGYSWRARRTQYCNRLWFLVGQ